MHIFYVTASLRFHEMKLCVKVLRPASGRSRTARVVPCHWSEGCWGVTAGKSSHNASNARGVTAGKMGHNSSINENYYYYYC